MENCGYSVKVKIHDEEKEDIMHICATFQGGTDKEALFATWKSKGLRVDCLGFWSIVDCLGFKSSTSIFCNWYGYDTLQNNEDA